MRPLRLCAYFPHDCTENTVFLCTVSLREPNGGLAAGDAHKIDVGTCGKVLQPSLRPEMKRCEHASPLRFDREQKHPAAPEASGANITAPDLPASTLKRGRRDSSRVPRACVPALTKSLLLSSGRQRFSPPRGRASTGASPARSSIGKPRTRGLPSPDKRCWSLPPKVMQTVDEHTRPRPGEHAQHLLHHGQGAHAYLPRFTVRQTVSRATRHAQEQGHGHTEPRSDEVRALFEIDASAHSRSTLAGNEQPQAAASSAVPAEGRWSSQFGLRQFQWRTAQPTRRPRHRGSTRHAGPQQCGRRSTGLRRLFLQWQNRVRRHGHGLIASCTAILTGSKSATAHGWYRGFANCSSARCQRPGRGPHLHWSMILNNTMVDPELFLPPRH